MGICDSKTSVLHHKRTTCIITTNLLTCPWARAGILDALNINKAHIVGHDWGSAVAWAFAGLYPERTFQLVGISVGHPSGYQKGEHRGAQKETSWCVRSA